MRRYLSGKRMKFTAIAMFFNGAVILLSLAGYGECLSEEEVAETIDQKVYYNTGLGLHKQFAYLYLHDTEGEVYFDNNEVRKVLNNKLTANPVTEVTSIWPFTFKDTNFLLAVSDKYIPALKKRGRHAEHKLLSVLKSMMDGYRSRYAQCPTHIILASVYLPCIEGVQRRSALLEHCFDEDTFVNERNDENVQTRNLTQSECSDTKLHRHRRCPEPTHPEGYRMETTNLIQQDDINILFPPDTLLDSAFYQTYCVNSTESELFLTEDKNVSQTF